jgi:hypothetical protein
MLAAAQKPSILSTISQVSYFLTIHNIILPQTHTPHHCPFVSAINANLLLSHNSHSYESKNSKISFLLRGNIFSSFYNHNHWSFDSSSPWGIPFFTNGLIMRDNRPELSLRYPTTIFASTQLVLSSRVTYRILLFFSRFARPMNTLLPTFLFQRMFFDKDEDAFYFWCKPLSAPPANMTLE